MVPAVPDLLARAESRLHGVDSPRLSAEVLLAEVLGCSRLSLVVERDRVVSDSEEQEFAALVERRALGEPLAYILGRKEFYDLDFTVSPAVLIPRPETEHIVEAVEERFDRDAIFHFADLGTGSGILAVTLAHLFPRSTGAAVDVSPDALAVARENAHRHAVSDRVEFLLGDFTQPLLPDNSVDLVVSNPPYVPEKEYAEASFEVRDFEPVGALTSGEDGLDHIRGVLPRVESMLCPGGSFLMEIGYQQGASIRQLIIDNYPGFDSVSILKDLAGHDRIVMLRYPES